MVMNIAVCGSAAHSTERAELTITELFKKRTVQFVHQSTRLNL